MHKKWSHLQWNRVVFFFLCTRQKVAPDYAMQRRLLYNMLYIAICYILLQHSLLSHLFHGNTNENKQIDKSERQHRQKSVNLNIVYIVRYAQRCIFSKLREIARLLFFTRFVDFLRKYRVKFEMIYHRIFFLFRYVCAIIYNIFLQQNVIFHCWCFQRFIFFFPFSVFCCDEQWAKCLLMHCYQCYMWTCSLLVGAIYATKWTFVRTTCRIGNKWTFLSHIQTHIACQLEVEFSSYFFCKA